MLYMNIDFIWFYLDIKNSPKYTVFQLWYKMREKSVSYVSFVTPDPDLGLLHSPTLMLLDCTEAAKPNDWVILQ